LRFIIICLQKIKNPELSRVSGFVADHADEWLYAIDILPENERLSNAPPGHGDIPRTSNWACVAFGFD
jgi:hypothetical protein